MYVTRLLARIVEAGTGFILGTTGACTLVAVVLICLAVLLVGPGPVVEYLVKHFAAFEHLAA